MKKILFKILFISLFIVSSKAAELNTPMEVQTSAVMPKGISNLRFRGIFANSNNRFNEIGRSVPLSDPFYKNITWNDFIDAKTDSEDASLLFGYLDSKKIDRNQLVGTTTGDIHVEARPIVPIFIHGVTDRLTMVLAVPVIRYKISAKTGFIYGESLKKVYDELEKDQKFSELNELSRKMVNPIATKLDEYDLAPISNQEGTLLGDLTLAAKYMTYQKNDLSLATQLSVTLPTGKSKSENNLMSVGSDHIWALGPSIISDYRLNSWLGVTGSTGYTYKIPDTVEKRVPYRQDSKVTPDKDQNVKRKIGDEFFAQGGFRFYPSDALNLSLGYTIQYKSGDQYRGSKYEEKRYQWIAANTIQRQETITAGLSFNTIYFYLEKKFFFPFEMALNHSIPVSGKNTNRDSLTTFDFSLFF